MNNLSKKNLSHIDHTREHRGKQTDELNIYNGKSFEYIMMIMNAFLVITITFLKLHLITLLKQAIEMTFFHLSQIISMN